MDHATGDDHSTAPFIALADLASSRVGGRAIAANDDFFAPKSNLVRPEAAGLRPGQIHGARQVDGRLGVAAPPHARPRLVRRRARHARRDSRASTSTRGSSQATSRPIARSRRSTPRKRRRPRSCDTEGPPWVPLLPKSALQGDRDNCFAVNDDRPWTHVRLNIFPDGGVARLRVYGEVTVNWDAVSSAGHADRPRVDQERRPRPRARATCISARATT